MSILYREVSEPGLEFLSLRIGLAVVTAIESTIPGLRLGLKWPNDVMLGDRKAGGVLCEARWQGAQLGWVGVGVGINVVNPIPEELKDSAVALATAGATNVEELVAPVVTRLRELRLGVTAMPPEELAEFRGRDWLQGRPLTEPVAGIARGIAADGALLVERVDGSMVSAKAGRVISD